MTLADVLMRQNHQDYSGVKALAAEIGVRFMLDPTITPMMDGDRGVLSLNVNQDVLQKTFRDEGLVGNVEEFCSTPKGASAGRNGIVSVQRGAHILLRFAVRRRVSLRAVSVAERQRAPDALRSRSGIIRRN